MFKNKWVKRISLVVFSLVLLVILAASVAIGYVLYNINDIAHRVVEYACNQTFGVPSSVARVRFNPFNGHLVLHDLHVSNPPQYTSDHFLTIQKASIRVDLFSLRSDVVDIPDIEITGIDLNLEQKDEADGGNFGPILKNIKASRKGPETQGSKPASNQRYVIHKIVLREITVHASESFALKDLASKGAIQTYKLNDIELTDVGTNNQSVVMEQVVGVITASILRQASDQGLSVLPQRLVGKLFSDLGDVGDVGVDGVKMSGQLLIDVGSGVLGTTGDVVKTVGKGVITQTGNAVNGVGKGIGGLFGDNEKSTQPAEKVNPTKKK